jgi:transposase
MRKIKEVLRLRFGLGLQQDQIARSCSIGQATVHRYLEKAAAAKVTWPLPDDFDDRRLDELLFPKRPLRTPSQPRPGIDFAQLHTQLQTYKHLTLQLLWEEYRETHPEGYGYSRVDAGIKRQQFRRLCSQASLIESRGWRTASARTLQDFR